MFRNLARSPLLLVLLFAALLYWPGLHGGFLFDDGANIADNPFLTQATGWNWRQIRIAAFSYGSGLFQRPLSMATLALNHIAGGLDPFGYKLVNLAIHLATGAGLYWLTRLLLAAPAVGYAARTVGRRKVRDGYPTGLVALAVAAAWLLHPFNLTGVLYVVQRMTSLSALFCVLAMIAYALGRLRQLRGRPGAVPMLAGLLGGGALAFLSKENGALLPLFLLAMEWTLFRFQAATAPARRFVRGFHALFTLGPLLLAAGLLAANPGWLLGSYAYRDFTLGERLFTESRVLWFYLRCILLPATGLMGLYHDDIALSKSLFDPPTTWPAILGLLVLAGCAVALRKRAPVFAFGVLFFFAGHAMESGVFALEIAHEHRNYLPAYGVLLPVFFYLWQPPSAAPWVRQAGPVLAGVLILFFAAGTALRAAVWGNDLERAALDVRHHPASARSRVELGHAYAVLAERSADPGPLRAAAREQFLAAARHDRYALAGPFAVLVLDGKDGRPADPALVSDLAERLARPPLAPASANALIELSRCRLEGRCPLAADVLWRLFDAILRNPNLRGASRAQILTEIVQQELARGDGEAALSHAGEAVRQDPSSPQVHLNLANLLIAAKDAAGAREHIDRARALDRDGYYEARVAAQEKLLAELLAGK